MHKIIVSAFILSLCFVSAAPLYCKEIPKKRAISIGRATDDVIKQQKKIEPIIQYLSSRLKNIGIERGEVILAGDNKISTLIKLVREEKIDIILESPFTATLIKIKANATPILTTWRKGVGEYNSLIFVRKDSKMKKT